MSFPAYPEYKDSGVVWLGGIPAHWNIKKFRYVFEESPEKITDEVVGDMLSVSGYRGIEVKQYDDEGRRRTDEELLTMQDWVSLSTKGMSVLRIEATG